MKKLTYIGIIMLAGILICAANLWAEPANYLASEGSSYGLVISQEAKQDAMKVRAKEDRMLLYQSQIEELGSDSLELQINAGDSQEESLADYDITNDSIADVSPCGSAVDIDETAGNDEM